MRISDWSSDVCSSDLWEIEVVGKGVHTTIVCNQVVDCTGNALPTAMAGFGVLREEEIQPGTLQFRIGGYDIKTLDRELINKSYKDAIEKGDLVKTEFRGNILALLSSKGDNIQHIMGADSTTSDTNHLAKIGR